MQAITQMCSRIENNVQGVTSQINNLEQRLGSYESNLNSVNESKIINVLNESRVNNDTYSGDKMQNLNMQENKDYNVNK